MATFKKGQSMSNQRIHVSAVFEQKGKMKGQNIAFSISNDTREGKDVITDPMLQYNKFEGKDGKEKTSYTAGYSQKQWEAIEAVANKDGDKLVLNADLMPAKRGKDGKSRGLIVNTNSMSTPTEPFDMAKHQEVTTAAREANKAAALEKAAAAKAEPAPEASEDELDIS